MRPTTVTVTGTGVSVPIPLDYYTSPVNVALGCVVTGTNNYTVQYTYDDVFAANYVPASGNWINHPTLVTKTTTADSNLAFPARAVRIQSNSGAGSTTMTVIQAGTGA